MIKIADFLAKNGHDVFILHAPMNPNTVDTHGKVAKVIRPSTSSKLVEDLFLILNKKLKEIWDVDSLWNPYHTLTIISNYNKWLAASCEHIIKENNLTKSLRNENFDLGIGEAFVPCVFGMFKYYNIKNHVAVMSGIPFDSHYNEIGINFPIGQVPSIFGPMSEDMSFQDRLYNVFFYLTVKYLHNDGVSRGNDIFRRHAPSYNINLENIFTESVFYISNTDPLVNYGAPGSPKMIQLGGFLLEKPQPLNPYFDKILNIRKNNVIISFGTFARSIDMPEGGLNSLAHLFESFPNITFIFKFEVNNFPFFRRFKNVITTTWLPQYSLLNDKRISAFIMHGGENSLLESSRAGVPMLAIPIFYDQPRNAKMISVLHLGRWIEKSQFINDKYKFVGAFKDVFENPLYKESIKKVSRMIKKRPYNESESFLKHIEFACEFGEVKNFNIGNQEMPFYQRTALDIFLFLIICTYTVIYLTISFLKFMYFSLIRKYYTLRQNNKNGLRNALKQKAQ
uniref:glucuronosyltransferase n=1 Tax=Strongyloides papillosus TaxID=174720 RepID=A0A0N5BLA4_STREA